MDYLFHDLIIPSVVRGALRCSPHFFGGTMASEAPRLTQRAVRRKMRLILIYHLYVCNYEYTSTTYSSHFDVLGARA